MAARRVLAVAQAPELGGAEYALLRTARGLPAHGFQVELTAPGPGGFEEAAREEGMAVHRLPVGALGAGKWGPAVRAWPRARRLARRSGADAVYLNGSVAQRLAPAVLGTAVVPHLHDLLTEAPRPWRSRRFWRSVPVMVCASKAVQRRAADLGAPRDRLRTIYPPVDPPEPTARPPWAGHGPVVGYVGRIEPRKGTLDLLAAAPALFERVPDARIVIVGDDEFHVSENYLGQVRAGIAALGERATGLGRVEDAGRLMPWFDVLAVPSLVEPFGTVAAEALAGGTPVVATRSGGMAEYVLPGENGELVDPGKPAELAVALATVLDRRDELARGARASARRFGSDRVLAELAAALEEAIEARMPG